MRNVLNKPCKENQNTHFMSPNLKKKNCIVYEIKSKNMVGPERPQMAIWRRAACWISKATRANTARSLAPTPTHTHSHTHARAHTQK